MNIKCSRVFKSSASKLSALEEKLSSKTKLLKSKCLNSTSPSSLEKSSNTSIASNSSKAPKNSRFGLRKLFTSTTSNTSGCGTCELSSCKLNADRFAARKAGKQTLSASEDSASLFASRALHLEPVIMDEESTTITSDTPAYDDSHIAQQSLGSAAASRIENNNHETPRRNPSATQPQDSKVEQRDALVWGDVRQIEPDLLLSLAAKILEDEKLYDKAQGDLKIIDRLEGSYNSVTVIQLPSETKYCLRIPAAGRPERWTEEDADLWEADAMTMRYIKRKSGLRMPEVIRFDSKCFNRIGHPYLFTTFIEGKPVYEVWDDDSCANLEDLRQNILKSIATEISKLHCLTWEFGMGMLDFESEDDPQPSWTIEVNEGFLWEKTCGFQRELTEVQKSLLSIIDYRQTMQDVYLKHTPDWCGNPEAKWRKGEQILLNLMIHCLPDAEVYDVTTKQPDIGSLPWLQLSQRLETLQHTTMTIAPPDLNMQNIMVDHDGNVTGFLDWDSTQVVPCYRGWARYPKWLYRDWSLFFDNDSNFFWDSKELERYRQDYARYMNEAMDGEGDCLFTSKSHLYESLHEALRLRLRRQDFVDKVLAILYPRVDPVLFLERLQSTNSKGQRGLKREEMVVLWERLKELFEPVAGPDLRFCF